MTYLHKELEYYTNSRNQIRNRYVYTYDCDQCKTIFSKTQKIKGEPRLHFCCNDCALKARQIGGVLNNKMETTNLARYGVRRPMQSTTSKENYVKTSLSNHGTNNPMQVDNIKLPVITTMRNTFKERYGVEHPLQVKEFAVIAHTNAEITRIKRYGVHHIIHIPGAFQKSMQSRRHVTFINHWKTGEELTCTANYERAFVTWANQNKIDFDWQIVHLMPDGRHYIIDAFIKDGEYTGVWIEIKGWHRNTEKWDWFHSNHPDTSQLWTKQRLNELGIL